MASQNHTTTLSTKKKNNDQSNAEETGVNGELSDHHEPPQQAQE